MKDAIAGINVLTSYRHQSAMPPMDGETIFVGALMVAVPLAGAALGSLWWLVRRNKPCQRRAAQRDEPR